MRYSLKQNYLKKVNKIAKPRHIIIYNIINKMVSHLNIDGKKKKLTKVIFKFFQKYRAHAQIKHTNLNVNFKNSELRSKKQERINNNSVNKSNLTSKIKNNIETLYETKLRLNSELGISSNKPLSYPWENQYYSNNLVQGFSNVFYQSRPLFDTKKVRKGPKYYDVPCKLKVKRSQLLVLRWFSKAVKSKNLRTITLKIQDECENLIYYEGSTFAEILKVRKHVLSNIMYSHYRWWNKKKAGARSFSTNIWAGSGIEDDGSVMVSQKDLILVYEGLRVNEVMENNSNMHLPHYVLWLRREYFWYYLFHLASQNDLAFAARLDYKRLDVLIEDSGFREKEYRNYKHKYFDDFLDSNVELENNRKHFDDVFDIALKKLFKENIDTVVFTFEIKEVIYLTCLKFVKAQNKIKLGFCEDFLMSERELCSLEEHDLCRQRLTDRFFFWLMYIRGSGLYAKHCDQLMLDFEKNKKG